MLEEESTQIEPSAITKQAVIASTQISLMEMFFVTTLCAIGVGIYLYVSQLLALLGGGVLIVSGVVRLTGCRNLVLGGLLGFLLATIVSTMIVILGGTSTSVSIGIAVLCPPAGYVLGALLAELRDDVMG